MNETLTVKELRAALDDFADDDFVWVLMPTRARIFLVGVESEGGCLLRSAKQDRGRVTERDDLVKKLVEMGRLSPRNKSITQRPKGAKDKKKRKKGSGGGTTKRLSRTMAELRKMEQMTDEQFAEWRAKRESTLAKARSVNPYNTPKE